MKKLTTKQMLSVKGGIRKPINPKNPRPTPPPQEPLRS